MNSQENLNFDELVLKYKDMVFNLCYRFTGNYHDANDCAQETFLKAYKGFKNFRAEANFSTWLYRIGVNTCKNYVRSLAYRMRKMMVFLDRPKANGNPGPAIEIQDNTYSPEASIEKKEQEEQLQRAIDALPEDQKSVVILRDIDGLSYDEIAEITGLNLGTVKSKLFRAREVLRNLLKGMI